MQVIVDSLLVHYERTGSGKTLVILPGWADTTASWKAVAARLASHYDVVSIDMPGFGGSQQPDSAWGLDEYAQFIGRVLEKLELGSIYAVLGHSNGGAVAIRGTAQGLLNPEKLVLLASAGIRDEGANRKQLIKSFTKLGKALTAPLPKRVRRRLRQRLYTSIGSDYLVAEHMQESFKKVVSADVLDDAARLRVPTLLLYGDRDVETPPRFGQRFAALIPNAQYVPIASAGHFLQLDQPEAVIKQIEEFLT
ncbi:MAG TPA: alpha/beta hydrolase [Candidatus Limnocylindrales bacterium]|nr:alpha/beta hydrolase [Candidatus Limnocylindrales bacterium]